MSAASILSLSSSTARRHLSTAQSSMATSMQRLSSGLRVNGARDDAAGLAIAERMQAQVRGMNAAVRNVNDGISLAQTADGALGRVVESLQRMRELSLQARTSTLAAGDRDALDREFGDCIGEIDRVLGGTRFNGRRILGADAGTLRFQVGAGTGDDDTIALTLQDLTASTAIDALLRGGPPSATALAAAHADSVAVAHAHMAGAHWSAPFVDAFDAHFDGSAATAAEAAALALHAVGLGADGATANALSAGVDTAVSADEVYARAAANAFGAGWQPVTTATFARKVYEAFDAQVEAGRGRVSIGAGIDAAGLADVVGDIDAAIDEIGRQRATFGAVLSRFDGVVATLDLSIEHQGAARGRIMDADFAAETARLGRAQILLQAGQAMVAQANLLPQSTLQLLR